MIVIKLGGSLAQARQLPACLDAIEQHYRRGTVVIVPGGGGFADQVRHCQQRWRFDDCTAHAMALLAMAQMALLFNGLKQHFVIAHSVAQIRRQLAAANVVIWSPELAELDNAGVAASWDITSDSLAAWLAGELAAAELLLIKAAAIDDTASLAQLAERGIIDPAFVGFAAQATCKITVINARQFICPDSTDHHTQ
jgi:aspartokinase-like uncharacterized kinase